MLEVDADFSKVKHFGIEYPLQVVEVRFIDAVD